MITNEMLSRFSADFNAEKCHKIAMNAVTQNGVTKSAMSPMALRKDEHQFSINLKQGEITNQKSSGRCWPTDRVAAVLASGRRRPVGHVLRLDRQVRRSAQGRHA